MNSATLLTIQLEAKSIIRIYSQGEELMNKFANFWSLSIIKMHHHTLLLNLTLTEILEEKKTLLSGP